MALESAQTVDVVSPGGELGTMPQEALQEALAQGYRIPSPEELQAEATREKFSDRGASALGLGALRGATLGLSDIALAESGAIPKETISGIKEFNPEMSLTGDIVGMVAPAFLSGGGSTLAKGAGVLPAGMVAKLGEGIAKSTLSGASKSLVKTGLNPAAQKILSKMAAMGVAGAAEGAIYGGANVINEQFLDAPPEYAAEILMSDEGLSNILKGSLKGAAFGLGVGAGVAGITGAGGALTRSSFQKLSKLTDGWFSAERLATKAVGPYKKQLKDLGRFAKYSDNEIDDALLNGRVSYLDRNLLGIKEVGKDLLEEGVIPKSPLGTTIENSRDIAAMKTKEWGEKIGDTLSQADLLLADKGKEVSTTPLQKRLFTEVIDPLKAKGIDEFENVAERIEKLVTKRFSSPLTTLDDLHKARVDIDELLYTGGKDPSKTLYNRNLLRARGVIEDFLSKNVDDAVKGTPLEGAYQLSKRKYAAMKWARDTAENRILQEGANRMLSPSDQWWAGISTVGTTVARGGFDPYSIAMGIFGGVTARVLRKRGASMGAGALSQLNSLGKMNEKILKSSSLIERAVDRFLDASPSAFVTPISIKTGALDVKGNKASLDSRVDQIMNRLNDPEMLAQVEESFSGLGEFAPHTALSLSINTAKALEFLRDRAPQKRGDMADLLTPYQFGSNDHERSKWERYRAIVENPLSVVTDIEKETVTPEAIETLRTVYPAIFQKIQQTMLQKIEANTKRKINYQKRLQISALFGLDLDPTLSQQSVARFQSNFQQPQANQMPGKAGSPRIVKPFNVLTQPSNIDRATMR